MDRRNGDFIRIDTDTYRWKDRDTLQKLVKKNGSKIWVNVPKPKVKKEKQ